MLPRDLSKIYQQICIRDRNILIAIDTFSMSVNVFSSAKAKANKSYLHIALWR